MIGGLEAPRRQRRSRPADAGATPVDVTRATVIGAAALDGEARGRGVAEGRGGRARRAGAGGAQPRAPRAQDRGGRSVCVRGRAAARAGDARRLRDRRAGGRRALDRRARPPARAAADRARGGAAPGGALRGAALGTRRRAGLRAARAARAARTWSHGRDREAALAARGRSGGGARGAGGLARARRDGGDGWRSCRGWRARSRLLPLLRGSGYWTRRGGGGRRALGRLEAALRARTAGASF